MSFTFSDRDVTAGKILEYAVEALLEFSAPLFPVLVTTAGLRDEHLRFGLGGNIVVILKNALPTEINVMESIGCHVKAWPGALHLPPLVLGSVAVVARDNRPLRQTLETLLRSGSFLVAGAT